MFSEFAYSVLPFSRLGMERFIPDNLTHIQTLDETNISVTHILSVNNLSHVQTLGQTVITYNAPSDFTLLIRDNDAERVFLIEVMPFQF